MHPGRLPTRVVFGLIFCGVVAVAVRNHWRSDIWASLNDTAWRLTYFVECEAERSGTKLRIASPSDTPFCRVAGQDFRQENLRIDPRGHPSSYAREIVALAEEPGPVESTLRFELRLKQRGNRSWNGAPAVLSADERAKWLRADRWIQVDDRRVTEILDELRRRSSDQATLMHAIFNHCSRDLSCREDDAAGDAATVLRDGSGTPRGCARAMIALCRAAKVPARPVAGFIVDSRQPISGDVWLEAMLNDRWVPYDPVNGHEHGVPYNYVPARRGDERIVLAEDADEMETEYALVQLPRASLGTAAVTRDQRDILDLTRLSLEMQHVLSLILLMPLGAVVTSVFRNLIGLRTTGTFTPTLLALSFVFGDSGTGLVILVATVVLGVTTRYLIDRLKLLILPRLSLMLTLVVLCIVFGVSALDYYRAAPGAGAVLLPMVILTMLIERSYLTAQEDGARVAVQHLAGTFVVGFCCYLVFRWEAVAALLLAYPEIHLFTVALLVLIGRYTGYQLFEAWRFREFSAARQG